MTQSSNFLVRSLSISAIAMVGINLSGCSANQSLDAQKREQISADKISDSDLGQLTDQLDTSSLRLQWSSEDAQYFSATGKKADELCLVTVVDDVPASSCSTQLPITVVSPSDTVALSFDAPETDGWKEVGDDLWLSD